MIRLALAIVLLFASAASAQVADGFVSQHVASYGADGRPLVYVSYDTQISASCWWCPQCQKWHCGPRPQMGQPTRPQQPQEPIGDTPQYESRPPQNPTPPPTTPPDNPPTAPPQQPEPEPTIDQETIDRITADAKAEAIAAAKAEVSVLVKNEIAANGCGCAEKWAALEQRLLEIDSRLTALGDTDESQATVNVSVQNLLTELSESVEAAKPNYDVIADEMQKRLTHSATVTLLNGTEKLQTKPLHEPLDIVQHRRDLK